jgi:hypothetical protein
MLPWKQAAGNCSEPPHHRSMQVGREIYFYVRPLQSITCRIFNSVQFSRILNEKNSITGLIKEL